MSGLAGARILAAVALAGVPMEMINGCGGGSLEDPSTTEQNGESVGLAGRVASAEGVPIAGARVAFYRPGRFSAERVVATGADGLFRVGAGPGIYALTATAPGYTAGFLGDYRLVNGARPVGLALQPANGIARGIVRDPKGHPVPNALVRASQWTTPESRLFYTFTDEQGRYQLGLAADALYTLTVQPGEFVSSDRTYIGGSRAEVDLVAYPWRRVNQPAPDSVVDWFRSKAIQLRIGAPGKGLDEMRSLGAIIGRAQIVGLGEATHGAREFFLAKRQVLEYLVTELGFSVFAIEAALPEAMIVNDYVLEGRGDVASALAGLHFWTTDTEEMLATLRWMRDYNANPSHPRKIRFYGFDMQYTEAAVTGVLEYIARVAPDRQASVTSDLEFFRSDSWVVSFAAMTPEEQLTARHRVSRVGTILDERRDGTEQWQRARQYVNVILQAAEMAAYGLHAPGVIRDRAMADNIAWIARNHPKERIVISAANGHISRTDAEGIPSMGSHLAAKFGERYLAVALLFGHGEVQGMELRLGQKKHPIKELRIGQAPHHYGEAMLARVGIPSFAVALRDRPESGPVAEWFDTPHPIREFGATYLPPDYHWQHLLLDRHFDALIYVDRTTRARPTPTGRRD